MRFARWIFLAAGLFGLLVLVPQFFLEDRIGRDQPPPITHPEYFYGFLGVAVAWQVAFLIIARDPVRFRPIMLAAILEKLSFGVAALALYAQGRLAWVVAVFGGADLAWAALFVIALQRTKAR